MAELLEEIAAFTVSAHWVDDLVGNISEPVWRGPGLGDWDLRSLVGHTSRALLTVERYLALPAGAEEIRSAEAYYEWTGKVPLADTGAVLQRGIDAGEALGDDPAAEFSAIVERVTEHLPGLDDRPLTTIAGGMLLSNYLPTRTFELVVHGLDIARAAELELDPPKAGLGRALRLATSLAERSGDGVELLLALTGRGGLAPGFSVLP